MRFVPEQRLSQATYKAGRGEARPYREFRCLRLHRFKSRKEYWITMDERQSSAATKFPGSARPTMEADRELATGQERGASVSQR